MSTSGVFYPFKLGFLDIERSYNTPTEYQYDIQVTRGDAKIKDVTSIVKKYLKEEDQADIGYNVINNFNSTS